MAKRTPVRPTQSASAVTALGTTARKGMPRRSGAGFMPARSLGEPLDQLGDAELGDHGLAGDRALAEQHLAGGARRKVDVDPAAEADQADALAGDHPIARLDPGHDP